VRIDYWIWALPDLSPISFSLVVKNGADGFACYVNGSNILFYQGTGNVGYTDGEFYTCVIIRLSDAGAALLAEYLGQEALKMSPKLLGQVIFSESSNLVLADGNSSKSTTHPRHS
jgi:hypothetical protein